MFIRGRFYQTTSGVALIHLLFCIGERGSAVLLTWYVLNSISREIWIGLSNMMRFRHLSVLFAAVLLSAGLAVLGQEKKPQDKLVFKSKMGDVPFDHAGHVKHAKNDCKACHDKLWPQDASAPLNFKAAMHKPAEAKKTSCGACHHAGGTAFESKGHCNDCHVKAGAKKK
jgi:c(7)-type cytochrome triheme protein